MHNTIDKYVRKEKIREEDQLNEHEIRVTNQGTAGRYIARAGVLFLDDKLEFVTLKAAGAAISTLCLASEIIKRRIKGLHQINKLTNTVIVDEYDPIEEGLDSVKVERQLSVLEIKLTLKPDEDEKLHYGYQPPLDESEVQPMDINRVYRGRGGRRGGRGFRRGGRGFRRGDRGGFRGGRGYGRGYGRGGYRPDYDSEDRRGGRGFRRGGRIRQDRGYRRYEEGEFEEREYEDRRGGRGGYRRGGRGGYRGEHDDYQEKRQEKYQDDYYEEDQHQEEERRGGRGQRRFDRSRGGRRFGGRGGYHKEEEQGRRKFSQDQYEQENYYEEKKNYREERGGYRGSRRGGGENQRSRGYRGGRY